VRNKYHQPAGKSRLMKFTICDGLAILFALAIDVPSKEISRVKTISMSLTFVLFACVLAGPRQIYAQGGEPDLSGTWVPQARTSLRRNWTLEIEQSGARFTMIDRFEFEKEGFANTTVLYSDGRGENNSMEVPGDDKPLAVSSITEWKKGKLVRRSKYEAAMMLGPETRVVQHTRTETYSLSKDGSSLIVESVSRPEIPFSNIPHTSYGKVVYRRKN
jgi:hypothetical protein